MTAAYQDKRITIIEEGITVGQKAFTMNLVNSASATPTERDKPSWKALKRGFTVTAISAIVVALLVFMSQSANPGKNNFLVYYKSGGGDMVEFLSLSGEPHQGGRASLYSFRSNSILNLPLSSLDDISVSRILAAQDKRERMVMFRQFFLVRLILGTWEGGPPSEVPLTLAAAFCAISATLTIFILMRSLWLNRKLIYNLTLDMSGNDQIVLSSKDKDYIHMLAGLINTFKGYTPEPEPEFDYEGEVLE